MNTFIEVKATKHSLLHRMSISGVGVNDSWYQVKSKINGKQVMCPYYMKWNNMIKRCYSEKHQKKRPTYIGCSVCDEWLTFSNFRRWMSEQDWYGKEIDKDLLFQGNKVYSPSTCIFVSREINTLFNNCGASRGPYPQGVSLDSRSNKFIAAINRGDGKGQSHLGSHSTPDAASIAYKKAKYRHISEVANKQCEPLRSALLAYVI